ncbi:MAG: M56 family metallopeptidase [Oscillospiraceae bacterium]|nr:M56 family metallopeptidase [Oscillospiraceae bacterium]
MMVMIESWIIPSSLMIAAVLAIRFALRGKISLRLQYALWAVVLVRLLLPFQIFISPFSADAVVEELNIPGAMQQAYISANEDAYERQYDATYHESMLRYESQNQQVDPVVVEREAAEYAQLSMVLDLRFHLMNLWLRGMAAMALVIVACNLHFARRLRRSRRDFPVPDCPLRVYVANAVPTPCVFGLFRPAIYLPPTVAEDEAVLRHALTHELTHYRHLDHVWSVLRSICLVLHWYNPLVWIAAKVSRADGELACDEGALRVLGEAQRGDYGRTLIGLTCGGRLGSLFVTATTMTGSAGSIRERINLLMKRPRTTALTLTALILVVTVIVGCTFSTAPVTEQPGIDLEGMGEKIQNGTQNGDVFMDFLDTTEPTGHPPENDMSYHAEELPIPENPGDPTVQIAALFSAEGDPIFRGALTRLYDVAVMEEIEYQPEELFIPEITQIDMTHDSDALVYYRKPGDHRLHVASVCDNSVWSNKLVVRMEDYAHLNPRELTEEELQQFRCVFGTLNLDGEINPAACFLLSHYEDITELKRRDFMAYFPIAEDGSRKEFELLKEKYPEFFGDWTWETMPIPIHRYDPGALTSVLQTYAGIRWEELSDDGTHYLEETGCYYNYTSDFGLGGFRANRGFVYDGGAVVCGDWSALFFTETAGSYTIRAHLPAIIAER